MKKLLLFLILFPLCNIVSAQQVSTVAGVAGLSGGTDGAGTSARFNEPHGVTADKNGNVYVADRLNNKIRKISPEGNVTTIAGNGTVGSVDGPGLSASFNEPWGITCDTLGNLYVADTKNYKIRMIDANGVVSTIAGTGVFGTTNGPVNTARFGFPAGITVTRDGQSIFVTDYNTHTIRKIQSGQVTTIAGTVFVSGSSDGSGSAATFYHPYGIEMTANGNLLIADEWNCKIRSMTQAGVVTTIAGSGITGTLDGSALTAQFNYPADITTDTLGNIFVADALNHTIRKISGATGQVSTYAGYAGQTGSTDGTGTTARFNGPTGLAYNRANHAVYVGDNSNHTIRKVLFLSTTALSLSLAGSSTVCAGQTVSFTITPAGLTQYTISENGVIRGTSATPTVTLNGLTQGNHTLQATAIDAIGATALSNTISVTVLPGFTPVITSSGGSAICNGASLTLSATSGSNYQWSTGATSPSITVTTAGSYSVSVTNGSGCRGTSAIFNVTVQSSPTAVITASTDTICPGKSTTLSASAGNSWLWSTGATTQSITTGAGSYTVTVTGAGGCTAVSVVQPIATYTVNTPTISPSGTITLFQGDSVLLQASGSGSYLWWNGATTSSVYASTSGAYTVIGTSSNGCTATSAVVQVIVISASTILSAQGPTTICDGETVLLQSIVPTGNQWYFEGSPVPGATSPQFTAADSGWYYVSVQQNSTWINSDPILITVHAAPDVPVIADTAVCKGASMSLQISATPGITYRWYDDPIAGNLITTGNNYITPAITINTTLYIEAVNSFGCASGRQDLDIIVQAVPLAAFTYSVLAQNGTYTTTYNCTTTNPDTYTWIFGDTSVAGNISYDPSPVITYTASGMYQVILITSNALGCTDTLIKKVYIGVNNPAFVPTTFTPNGDGKNDVFRVRGEQYTLQDMKIYDQWGTLIYTTNSSKPEWDGMREGKVVQNGTYVYKISIVDTENNVKELTGPVTVIK